MPEYLKIIKYCSGNYGRSYSYAAGRLGMSATVLMPDTAPPSRIELLQSMGVRQGQY